MKRPWLVVLLPFAAFAGWILLTTQAPASAVATWAPCPRNWAWGPTWLPRASPLESLSFRLGVGHVKVCYGAPSLRGRAMLGGRAVPFGELWRTGANEPTTIHSDRPFRIGTIALLPGSYSLYTVPDRDQWQIVVNRSTRQWGLESEYDDEVAALEVGRFPVPPERLTRPIERLAFRAETSVVEGVDLLLEWETTRVRIPLEAGFDPER